MSLLALPPDRVEKSAHDDTNLPTPVVSHDSILEKETFPLPQDQMTSFFHTLQGAINKFLRFCEV